MLKAYISAMFLLFTPHTQVVPILLADNVLDVSVVIHMKEWVRQSDGTEKLGRFGCSGTYVSEDAVLTAAHCFEYPLESVYIRGIDKVSHKVMVKKLDKSHDLALLYVPDLTDDHTYAKLAKKVKIGEQVVSVGSPFSLEFLVSEGTVAQLGVKADDFKSHYIIHTGMINPGSSGGGAFNQDGELMGVNTMSMGGLFGWAGISMAVSTKDIREFLK